MCCSGALGKWGWSSVCSQRGGISPLCRRRIIFQTSSPSATVATTPRDLVSEGDVQLMLLLLAESVCSRMRELASRCADGGNLCPGHGTALHAPGSGKLPGPLLLQSGAGGGGFRIVSPELPLGAPDPEHRAAGRRLSRGCRHCPDVPLRRGSAAGQMGADRPAVDHLRRRYGYMSVRRALLDTDPRLGHINVRDDHTVHPVGYFGG